VGATSCLTYSYLLIEMTVYKIKSEDKAAFLNRLEKLKINVSSNDLKNKTKLQDGNVISWFELTVTDSEHEQQINNIINQSPAINIISEMETKKKKMTKDQLKEMVRQELQAVLAEKKKVKDEDKKDKLDENEVLEESPIVDILGILSGVAGLGLGSAAIMKAQDMLKTKNPELFKKLQGVSGAIGKADPSKNLEEVEETTDEAFDPSILAPIGAMAGMAGLAFGIVKAGTASMKKELIAKFKAAGKELPDEKTLNRLAGQAMRVAMDRSTGGGMGADTPDVKI
jgi:hypothetical protein